MSLEGFQIFCPNKHSDVQLGQHTWNVHLGQQHTGRTFQVQIHVERTMMRTWEALNKDEKEKMSIMRLAIVETKVKAVMWLYWRHSCNYVYFFQKIDNHFFCQKWGDRYWSDDIIIRPDTLAAKTVMTVASHCGRGGEAAVSTVAPAQPREGPPTTDQCHRNMDLFWLPPGFVFAQIFHFQSNSSEAG